MRGSSASRRGFPNSTSLAMATCCVTPKGWEITAAGREFLRALEAVTQDNLPPEPLAEAAIREEGKLIVVGHRFRNRARPQRNPEPSASVRRRPFREPR
ncbi:hypothetical protein ACVWY2_006240 [Bradyrhizobium sp. JR6.1]